MEKHIVKTFDEWLALPELFIPTAAQSRGKGVVYHVLKVEFVLASPADCERHSLPIEPNSTGRCFLPTTFVREKDGSKKLYRLPLSLELWATDFVAMVRETQINPLPCDIEFALKDDRIYAEML